MQRKLSVIVMLSRLGAVKRHVQYGSEEIPDTTKEQASTYSYSSTTSSLSDMIGLVQGDLNVKTQTHLIHLMVIKPEK